MEHLPSEFWFAMLGQIIFFAMGWGDIRATVRNLSASLLEEKREREKLDDRLRRLEMAKSESFSFSKKAGG